MTVVVPSADRNGGLERSVVRFNSIGIITLAAAGLLHASSAVAQYGGNPYGAPILGGGPAGAENLMEHQWSRGNMLRDNAMHVRLIELERIRAAAFRYAGTVHDPSGNTRILLGLNSLSTPTLGGNVVVFARDPASNLAGTVVGRQTEGVCRLRVSFANTNASAELDGPCDEASLSGRLTEQVAGHSLVGSYQLTRDNTLH